MDSDEAESTDDEVASLTRNATKAEDGNKNKSDKVPADEGVDEAVVDFETIEDVQAAPEKEEDKADQLASREVDLEPAEEQKEEIEVVNFKLPSPVPLPPKRQRKSQSRATSRPPSVQRDFRPVRFASVATIPTLRRPQTTAKQFLHGAVTYAGLLVAYVATGSLLLLVIWRWFPSSAHGSESAMVTNSLTASLWNLTLKYNVLNEDQWRQEAAIIIRAALPNGKPWRTKRPVATWTWSFLVSFTLITTTGLAEDCVPDEHQSVGGQVFSVLFPAAGIPLFFYVQWQSSKFLAAAVTVSEQRNQLRWTCLLLSMLYILALGPVVLGGGLLPTLLSFSLIGPFPCNANYDSVVVLISCFYAFVGFHVVTFLVRILSDIVSTPRPLATDYDGIPEYANVTPLDRRSAFSRSIKRMRNRWQNTQKNSTAV